MRTPAFPKFLRFPSSNRAGLVAVILALSAPGLVQAGPSPRPDPSDIYLNSSRDGSREYWGANVFVEGLLKREIAFAEDQLVDDIFGKHGKRGFVIDTLTPINEIAATFGSSVRKSENFLEGARQFTAEMNEAFKTTQSAFDGAKNVVDETKRVIDATKNAYGIVAPVVKFFVGHEPSAAEDYAYAEKRGLLISQADGHKAPDAEAVRRARAQETFLRCRASAEQAQARLTALEKSGSASETDLWSARTDLRLNLELGTTYAYYAIGTAVHDVPRLSGQRLEDVVNEYHQNGSFRDAELARVWKTAAERH